MSRVLCQALLRCTALGALLALATVPASAQPTAPQVAILFVTPDALTDFAMDGDQVAWIGERRRKVNEDVEPCGLIFARSLSGGPAYTIAPRRDQIYGDVCADDRLALAGRHLFWVSTFGAHTTHRRLDNALIGAATSQILADHETDCSGGSFVDNTAGDAGTFAYTWGTYAIDCDNGDEIGRETAHLSVFRNGRLTQFRLRSLPGFIAVAAGHVATGEARETAVPRVFETEIVVYTPVGRVVR